MSQFKELIIKAKAEPNAPRMLFLFAKATNMMDPKSSSYNSGTIEPVICVDKKIEELTSFSDLVTEADSFTRNWNFIFVSSIAGTDASGPSDDEIDTSLKKMSNSLLEGKELTQFVIWNRDEEPVLIS